ncbi:MAG: dTMP kinase [Clostridiales bacterium]|nr:dTMP kinase [Clostridiales bacterium]MCF8021537.1 dTMP kinase [Clostridiales bacterium]
MEGIDGAGKSTQIKMLAEQLLKRGYEVLITKEPGGTPVGEQVRDILLNPCNKNMSYETEVLLYTADRAQHVQEKILPAVHEGKVVICDRFFDSTLAYQGGGRGIDTQYIYDLNKFALTDVYPDMVFILDVSPEVGMERSSSRQTYIDRLENENLNFYRRVREVYLQLAEKSPGNHCIIDGEMELEEINEEILKRLEEY